MEAHHDNGNSLDNHKRNIVYVTKKDNLAEQWSRRYRGESGQDWKEPEEREEEKAE
jgi:hypothetical protein